MLSLGPFRGRADVIYLCDAGCRPNPGTHLPVVWDGKSLLDLAARKGTNRKAAYQSVIEALKDARVRGFDRVEIHLTSNLVYRQLTGDLNCREPQLEELRSLCAITVPARMSVRLVLAEEPFNVGGTVFSTRLKLRAHALSGLQP